MNTTDTFPRPDCKKTSDIIICIPEGRDMAGVVIFAIYSYVPVAIFLVLIGWYLWKRSIIPLIALVTLCISLILNEAIIKNIVKQPRPHQSCACSFGMPSGHSLVSILLLSWVIFEYTYKPLDKTLKPGMRAMYISIAIAAFGLVPYSRVYLYYHTWQQVLVGASIGIFMSIVLFSLLRFILIHKFPKKTFKVKSVTLLINNYQYYHQYYEDNGASVYTSSTTSTSSISTEGDFKLVPTSSPTQDLKLINPIP